jgi:hypothetical protein
MTHSSITLRTFHSYSTQLLNHPLILQTTLNSILDLNNWFSLRFNMPSTWRNQQLIPDDSREDSATAESSSSLSSPVIVVMLSTPHTAHPTMQTLLSTLQAPPMGLLPASSPPPNESLMLMTMMQEMMAEMACSNVQVHVQLASTNKCMLELELCNQELRDTIPVTHNSRSCMGHSLSPEHSLQFTSHCKQEKEASISATVHKLSHEQRRGATESIWKLRFE